MQIAGVISASVVYSSWGSSQYYNFVVISGMVLASISILLNFVRVVEKFERIPWNFVVSKRLFKFTIRCKNINGFKI